jgi:hypothetical protein
MSRAWLFLVVLAFCTIFLIGNIGGAASSLAEKIPDRTLQIPSRSIDSYLRFDSDGDINVTDHETLTIQDQKYNLTGRIIAEDHATVVVRNSELTLSPSDGSGIALVLKEEARLTVVNSTIIFARQVYGDCQIIVQDEAEADFTHVSVTGWGFVVERDSSLASVENSTVGDGVQGLHSPGIATYGSSRVEVENSTVDGVYVWENSTSLVKDSRVGVVRTSWAESGGTMINISDSRIGSVETFLSSETLPGTADIYVTDSRIEYALYVHGNSTVWIESSSIAMVRATGNATVWLIASSVDDVSLEGSAEVLLGLNLPLFGLVGVPYSLIPIIQVACILIIVAGIAAMSYGVYLRKRVKEEQARNDALND